MEIRRFSVGEVVKGLGISLDMVQLYAKDVLNMDLSTTTPPFVKTDETDKHWGAHAGDVRPVIGRTLIMTQTKTANMRVKSGISRLDAYLLYLVSYLVNRMHFPYAEAKIVVADIGSKMFSLGAFSVFIHVMSANTERGLYYKSVKSFNRRAYHSKGKIQNRSENVETDFMPSLAPKNVALVVDELCIRRLDVRGIYEDFDRKMKEVTTE